MATSNGALLIEQLSLDDVENWLERLNEVILATQPENVSDRKKVSLLLAHIGQKGYKLLKSYCLPELPNTKSFDQLRTVLIEHLAPKPTVTAERFKFNMLNQLPNEGLALYMSRVRERAALCGFNENYDQMVRDRFICGLKDERTRSSLLHC